MNHWGSDRRNHPRFEIVGPFHGSLEAWRSCEVRNLARGGALVKTTLSYPPGTRLQSRVTVGGRHKRLPVAVRHVTARPSLEGGDLVGVELLETLPEVIQPLFEQARAVDHGPVFPERRASPRVERPEDVQLDFCEWLSVELRDMSMGGAMFTSTPPIEPGSRAQFHTRFGERRFTALVTIRRVARLAAEGLWEIGVSFVSMDDESQRNLAGFLATSTN